MVVFLRIVEKKTPIAPPRKADERRIAKATPIERASIPPSVRRAKITGSERNRRNAICAKRARSFPKTIAKGPASVRMRSSSVCLSFSEVMALAVRTGATSAMRTSWKRLPYSKMSFATEAIAAPPPEPAGQSGTRMRTRPARKTVWKT